jgi:hypothetical protein
VFLMCKKIFHSLYSSRQVQWNLQRPACYSVCQKHYNLEISFWSSRIIMFNTNDACTEKWMDNLCFPHLLATAPGLCIRFTLNGFSHILVMVLVLSSSKWWIFPHLGFSCILAAAVVWGFTEQLLFVESWQWLYFGLFPSEFHTLTVIFVRFCFLDCA